LIITLAETTRKSFKRLLVSSFKLKVNFIKSNTIMIRK